MITSKGSGLFRQEWYSICSRHREPREDCDICKVGRWEYVTLIEANRALHRLSPRLWDLWVNRPFFNPSRKFLESVFPKLRHR